jgi:hypothetical protein
MTKPVPKTYDPMYEISVFALRGIGFPEVVPCGVRKAVILETDSPSRTTFPVHGPRVIHNSE